VSISLTLPISSPDGQLHIYPATILDLRAVKCNNMAIPQLLIKWTNLPEDDASWEDYGVIAQYYPQFILEDKNNFEERGLSGVSVTELQLVEVRSGDCQVLQNYNW
jgi:Chromo (CHRromatin Organisation MOdifier) domain